MRCGINERNLPRIQRERGGREGEGRAWKSREEGRRRACEVEGREERETQEARSCSLAFLLSKSWKEKTAIRKKKKKMRNFPGVQWLRLQASTVRGMGSRVSKLRSCMLCGVARKKAGKGMKRWRRRRKSLTSGNVRISIFPLLPYGG